MKNTPTKQTCTARRRRRRWATAVLSTALAAGIVSVAQPPSAGAAPSGSTPWAVLLCQAQGTTAQPQPPSYYKTVFTSHDATNPTMADYWTQVSLGAVNIDASQVATKWTPTTTTLATLRTETRDQKIKACVDAAGSQITNPAGIYGIIAIWNINFALPTDGTANFGDSGAAGGGGPYSQTLNGTTQLYAGLNIEPWAMYPALLEHEMGHGYGLRHAFGFDNCYAVAEPDEYCDPYTTMGVSGGGYEFTQQAPPNSTATQLAGPGLDTFDLDSLGFIPPARKATVSAGPGQATTVTLTSLSAPNPTGLVMVKIPVGDSPDHYFTAEYRRQLGWDAGINGDGIVFHEVMSGYAPNYSGPISFLVPRSGNWRDGLWTTGQTTGEVVHAWPNGISVQILSIDPSTNTARLLVTGPPAAPTPPPTGSGGGGGGADNGQGSGGCGATGCGQHPPGWHPGPIHYA